MKLVILGNGFDLANNLPTKYENFFNYYIKLYENEFSYINGLLEKTKESSIKEDLSGVIEYETYLKVENELRKEMQKDFEIEQSLIDNEYITLWNLYFWFEKKSEMDKCSANEKLEMKNWSDVEGQIDKLINNFSGLTSLDPAQKINYIENLIEEWYTDNIAKTKNSITNYEINYKENIYAALSEEDKFKFICDSIVLKRYKKSKDDDIYYLNVLKKELEFFEEEFKKYISKISEKIIDKHKRPYRSNLLKVAGGNISAEIYLLNFNYTEFSRAGATKIDTVTMSNNKEHIEIKQINVHGTHHSKIIFGIDQTNQTEKNFYQFTKTYRKMECADKIATIQLPYPNDIDEIIIYGHSLSKADYSYFHSIFDYYNIYGSNIKLKFKYSTHGDPYVCKSNHVQKIMELIKTYGDKMFDTARGDNLVHKLLLENRLSIEEVVLNKLNGDVPDINTNFNL